MIYNCSRIEGKGDGRFARCHEAGKYAFVDAFAGLGLAGQPGSSNAQVRYASTLLSSESKTLEYQDFVTMHSESNTNAAPGHREQTVFEAKFRFVWCVDNTVAKNAIFRPDGPDRHRHPGRVLSGSESTRQTLLNGKAPMEAHPYLSSESARPAQKRSPRRWNCSQQWAKRPGTVVPSSA